MDIITLLPSLFMYIIKQVIQKKIINRETLIIVTYLITF